MKLHSWNSPRMLVDLPLQADLPAPRKISYRYLLLILAHGFFGQGPMNFKLHLNSLVLGERMMITLDMITLTYETCRHR